MIFGPRHGTSYTAITWNQESNFARREKNHSLFHCNFFDVSRTTHTNLDVMQERRIDAYWNIDGSRDLSDAWTGFIQFTLLSDKPPEGYMWSGWRLTKRQATSRPDHLWPELGRGMARNAKLREKQKWAMKNLNSIMHENYEASISVTLRTRSSRKPLGMQETIGNTDGSSHALQDMQEKHAWGDP